MCTVRYWTILDLTWAGLELIGLNYTFFNSILSLFVLSVFGVGSVRVQTVMKSHEKSWNLKMNFPGLEKSWILGKMAEVMEKSWNFIFLVQIFRTV